MLERLSVHVSSFAETRFALLKEGYGWPLQYPRTACDGIVTLVCGSSWTVTREENAKWPSRSWMRRESLASSMYLRASWWEKLLHLVFISIQRSKPTKEKLVPYLIDTGSRIIDTARGVHPSLDEDYEDYEDIGGLDDPQDAVLDRYFWIKTIWESQIGLLGYLIEIIS